MLFGVGDQVLTVFRNAAKAQTLQEGVNVSVDELF